MTTATNTPARAPVPGDLHRWDDLQDGCLYVDITEHHVDYAGCHKGCAQWLVVAGAESSEAHWPWFAPEAVFTALKANELFGVCSLRADVVAVGLETVDDFRAAIVAHRARTAA